MDTLDTSKLSEDLRARYMLAEFELHLLYGFGPEMVKALRHSYVLHTQRRGLGVDYTKLFFGTIAAVLCLTWAYSTGDSLFLEICFWITIGMSALNRFIVILAKRSFRSACHGFFEAIRTHEPAHYFWSLWIADQKNSVFIKHCFANKYHPPNRYIAFFQIACFSGIIYACIKSGHAVIAAVLTVLYIYKHYLQYQLHVLTARCLSTLRDFRRKNMPEISIYEIIVEV